jgi:hypothetical protein
MTGVYPKSSKVGTPRVPHQDSIQTLIDKSISDYRVKHLHDGGDGLDGKSAYELAVSDGFVGTEVEWIASLVGPAGESAYQVAVDTGFQGDEAAWLASLVGAAGEDSVVPGPPGDSAYDVAVAEGFIGDEAAWLASLVGTAGEDSVVPGPQGESAYDVAVAEGFVGDEAAWLLTLVGPPGESSNSGSSFRGEWSGLSVVKSYDFTDGIPQEFTNVGPFTVVANPGGVGAPPIGMIVQGPENNSSTLDLTVPADVSSVRYYSAEVVQNSFWSNPAGFKVNDTIVHEAIGWEWIQKQFSCAPGQTLEWFCNAIHVGWGGQLSLGLIELLGATDPYLVGDAVTYDGSLYVCASAATGSTPGVDGAWTKLLETFAIGTTPGTVAAGDDARIVAGGTAVQPEALGDSSGLDVGDSAGTVASGDDPRFNVLVPVQDAGGIITETTAIAYSAITAAAGVTFAAPPSGMVMAYLDIHLKSGVAGTEARAGLWVKEGSVIGSGTLDQTIEPMAANATDQWIKIGGSRLITGLVPSSDYNIQACFASETVDISVAASHYVLTVVPVPGEALPA